MLAAVRAFAKSWVAIVLIGLLIVSFAIFGINDVFQASFKDTVVSADGRTITSAEFKRAFDNQRQQLEQQMGQPITLQMAVDNGFDNAVLQRIASTEGLGAVLHKIGIRPSDEEVVAQLQKIPAFLDRVTGRFDKNTYQAALAQAGLVPETFERSLRDEIAQQQLAVGMGGGLRLPRAYAALGAISQLESRDLAYFVIDPRSMPAPAAPTDAQLTAFMNENAAQLRRPEFRVITVARFSPQAAAGNVAISEEELKKRYDFRKDTLSRPEGRSAVQIPVKDAATAQQVAARLDKGEAPAAIAKSLNVEAITYENKPQTAIPDRKVAAAVFSTPVNKAVPVQGDLGMAVIRVLAVAPGQTVTLDQARPALEAELRKDAAAQKVYELTQTYDEAHQGGASLTEAAQKAGVPTMTIGPVSKDGRDDNGAPLMGLNQKLMETAFSLGAGGESEIQEVGDGEYFAVRVERITPPAMPTLAEVKTELVRVWMLREMTKAMQTRAEQLSDRLRKGETMEAVAGSAGARVTRIKGVSRQTAGQHREMSEDTLNKTFNTKLGGVFTADNVSMGVVVGKLEAIHPGEGAQLAQLTEFARPRMSEAYLREMMDAATVAARKEADVKVDYNRARTALGLEPIKPPAGAAKK